MNPVTALPTSADGDIEERSDGIAEPAAAAALPRPAGGRWSVLLHTLPSPALLAWAVVLMLALLSGYVQVLNDQLRHAQERRMAQQLAEASARAAASAPRAASAMFGSRDEQRLRRERYVAAADDLALQQGSLGR